MSDAINPSFVVLGAIIVLATILAGQAAYWAWQSRQEDAQRELARRIGTLQDADAMPIIRIGEKRPEPGLGERLEALLVQAGNPYTMNGLWQRVIVAGLLGVGLFLLMHLKFFAIFGVVFGYVPVGILKFQADKRLFKITEQLPDALDLLARSLQAGHGISEGMRTVAEEMSDPIGPEFGRVFEEHNLGRDLREAFINLTRRYPRSFDIKLFASSVLLQRDTGGNLVEILNNIATTIRNRFVFQGKVSALTSEARFTAFVLGGLPFVVIAMLMITSPTYLKPLITDPLGLMITAACITSFSIGVYLMYEVSKVEV